MAAAYSFRSKGNQISQIKIFKYYKIMNEISLIQKSILVSPLNRLSSQNTLGHVSMEQKQTKLNIAPL